MVQYPNLNKLPWFAIKVRVKGEERVSEALEKKGYDVFLPTQLECRRYTDRIRKVNSAVFPGYIFGRLDANQRLPVLQTAGVEQILGIGKMPQPVPEAEIHAIKTVLNAGVEMQPWPYLRVGEQVVIQHGSLTGVSGQLVQCKGNHRLVLSVHLLQRSISVEIDRTWVRPALDHLAEMMAANARGGEPYQRRQSASAA